MEEQLDDQKFVKQNARSTFNVPWGLLDCLSTGPSVIFMLKHLKIAGCPFTADSIQCHPCPPTRSGGFSPEHGILLCQDRFFSKRHMEDTIVHEMIHAFDHCRFDVKWLDLRHHACSEVRRSMRCHQANLD